MPRVAEKALSLRLLQVHWLLAGLFITSLGCNRQAMESEAEAEFKPTAEGNVRLSREAQQSIGLETAQVRQQLVRDALSTTGWLMSKPGNEVVVKAMATGFVVPGDEEKKAELGTTVADHQELGKLHIFLSPQRKPRLWRSRKTPTFSLNRHWQVWQLPKIATRG